MLAFLQAVTEQTPAITQIAKDTGGTVLGGSVLVGLAYKAAVHLWGLHQKNAQEKADEKADLNRKKIEVETESKIKLEALHKRLDELRSELRDGMRDFGEDFGEFKERVARLEGARDEITGRIAMDPRDVRERRRREIEKTLPALPKKPPRDPQP